MGLVDTFSKAAFGSYYLYHNSFARDNPGKQFHSCNFFRRSTQDYPRSNHQLYHRLGHRVSPDSIDTRTYLSHLFHAFVLSASFEEKLCSRMEFAGYFSVFPVSISLCIVFAFTLTQYIVVVSPLKYGRMITK